MALHCVVMILECNCRLSQGRDPASALIIELTSYQPYLIIFTFTINMARAVSKMWERYCLRSTLDSTPSMIPVFLYGTAWKKDQTADLVYTAVNAGFRGIDTAAQPRHYQEHLVGDGIRRAIAEGLVRREDLYVSAR